MTNLSSHLQISLGVGKSVPRVAPPQRLTSLAASGNGEKSILTAPLEAGAMLFGGEAFKGGGGGGGVDDQSSGGSAPENQES